MDLKEIDNRKKALRLDMTHLLNNFIEETGVRRIEISTTYATLQAVGEEEETIYHGIEIKLEL